MKTTSIIFTCALAGTFAGCGSKEEKSQSTPVIVYQQPTTTQTDVPATQDTTSTETTEDTTTTADSTVDDSATTDASSDAVETLPEEQQSADTAAVDMWGDSYDDQMPVEFDDQYHYFDNENNGSYVYQDPDNAAYYQNVQHYVEKISVTQRSIPGQADLTYLSPSYGEYRGLLNYESGFKKVREGHGRWNQNNFRNMQNNFRKAKQWINRTCFNTISRNMKNLERRGFKSRSQLEARIQKVIKNRDHQMAVQLNDQLLDEYKGRSH